MSCTFNRAKIPVWAEILGKWLKALFQHLISMFLRSSCRSSWEELCNPSRETAKPKFAFLTCKAEDKSACAHHSGIAQVTFGSLSHHQQYLKGSGMFILNSSIFHNDKPERMSQSTAAHQAAAPQLRTAQSSIYQNILLPTVASMKFSTSYAEKKKKKKKKLCLRTEGTLAI